MSRFYVPTGSVSGGVITILGEEAHHIIDVMRLKVSDEIVAFDGTGKEYVGVITAVKARTVTVSIIRTIGAPVKSGVGITLIQAIPKKAKMDYIVEKATELGAAEIVPVFTARTIPEWDDDKREATVGRWRKIALGAAKQCGRSDIPEIGEIRDFAELVRKPGRYDLALIAALCKGAVELREALAGFRGKRCAIAIGPEGDFTPDEVEAAKEAGFRPVSLGARVLKSDTAGLAALAIIDYEFAR